MDDQRTIQVAVMSSALFVASLIHVPFGPVSMHLVLNGLAGLLLGWAVVPAYLTALTLQALFFGYGGITSLGVNTVVMATPGLLCYFLFGRSLSAASPTRAFTIGAAAGVLGILGGCALLCAALLTAGDSFRAISTAVLLGNLPVAFIEAVVTGSAVSFLLRVRPETFRLMPSGSVVTERPASSVS